MKGSKKRFFQPRLSYKRGNLHILVFQGHKIVASQTYSKLPLSNRANMLYSLPSPL